MEHRQNAFLRLLLPGFVFQSVVIAGGYGTGRELADRLSFFLWGSIGDAALLRVAAEGRLGDAAVMREEATRMLGDARARSLATDFAGQLFGFVGFEEHAVPDPERFPEFTPQVREGMIEEVVAFYVTREGARATGTTERILEPLDLTPEDQADLVAFLRSLTGAPADLSVLGAPAR